MVGKLLVSALLALIAIFVVIQAVPYGRDHTNPPAQMEPAWDSERTRDLTVRACFDCHSNATTWPWYSTIAPVSWLIQRDVEEGRAKLNFSEMDRPQEEAVESAKSVRDGEMPPIYYVLIHPDAALPGQEKQDLIDGLAATLGDESEGEEDN